MQGRQRGHRDPLEPDHQRRRARREHGRLDRHEFFRPPLSTTGANFEARNIRVVANVFVGGTVPIAFVGCVDCLAANNTIVDPENWILRILQETTNGRELHVPARAERPLREQHRLLFARRALDLRQRRRRTRSRHLRLPEQPLVRARHSGPVEAERLPAAETGGIYGQNPALVMPTLHDTGFESGSRRRNVD